MIIAVGLKNRENFMDNYLNPAIESGFVCLLYSNSPRHPRQKYLLSVKGLTFYNEMLKFPKE
ncbi:MAG: Fic family protein [Sodaliphilus sp.]